MTRELDFTAAVAALATLSPGIMVPKKKPPGVPSPAGIKARLESVAARFAVDDCWVWPGSKDRFGYGRTAGKGPYARAHRAYWLLFVGPIPDGFCVCHNCPAGDTPACFNPRHMFLGTLAENMADMCRKGRSATGAKNGSHTHRDRVPRGDRHPSRINGGKYLLRGDDHPMRKRPELVLRGSSAPRAKLTEEQVLSIVAMLDNGATKASIASRFGVSQGTVSHIDRGVTWSNLPAVAVRRRGAAR